MQVGESLQEKKCDGEEGELELIVMSEPWEIVMVSWLKS